MSPSVQAIVEGLLIIVVLGGLLMLADLLLFP